MLGESSDLLTSSASSRHPTRARVTASPRVDQLLRALLAKK
jgi:hypothetical protein